MSALVFVDQASSIIGRTWGETPHKGEVVSLVSDRRGEGRRRYRVLEIDRFYSDAAGDDPPVFEPGEVMVHVVPFGD